MPQPGIDRCWRCAGGRCRGLAHEHANGCCVAPLLGRERNPRPGATEALRSPTAWGCGLGHGCRGRAGAAGRGGLLMVCTGMPRAVVGHGTGVQGVRVMHGRTLGLGRAAPPYMPGPAHAASSCVACRHGARLGPSLLRGSQRRPARGGGGRGWRGAYRPRCTQRAGLNSCVHLATVILVFK